MLECWKKHHHICVCMCYLLKYVYVLEKRTILSERAKGHIFTIDKRKTHTVRPICKQMNAMRCIVKAGFGEVYFLKGLGRALLMAENNLGTLVWLIFGWRG